MVSLGVLGILAKPATELGNLLWRHTSYCVSYKSNVNNLREQVENLKAVKRDVDHSVEQAQVRGEPILETVKRWMERTTEIELKVGRLFDDDFIPRKTGKCSTRYVLSKNAEEIVKQVGVLLEEGRFDRVSQPARPPDTNANPAADFVEFESSRLAIEKVMEGLMDEEVHVIGLHGMGGAGKTVLIKEVGRRAKEDGLFDRVVTVVISQKPNLARIQAQIATLLGIQYREGANILVRAAELSERFRRERKVLVILDDIWDAIDLSEVGIPIGDSHRGCKVLVTTRRETVCHEIGNMGNHTRIIPLHPLSERDAWNLFTRNAGDIVNSAAIQDIARDVAKECGGLPIALVTVGRALRDKNNLRVWKAARDQLQKSMTTNIEGMHGRALPCLKLSYDYLDREEERTLFLLCSLFPEDYDISIELLVEYGVGLGLFQDLDTIEEARDRTLMIVENLKSSCLLLDGLGPDWDASFDYAIGSVRMHDVIRDMAISIASSSSSTDLCMVRADVGLQNWPRNNSASEKYTSISLMGNPALRDLPEGLNYPRLHTLLLQECYGHTPVTMPSSFFKKMRELRVLDLSHNIFQYPSPLLFEWLTKLRVLCIRVFYAMNTPVDLKFGALNRLEILRLGHFQLVAFPREIAQFLNLRLLDLTSCHFTKIPPGILSRLSQLEELYMKRSFNEWGMVAVQEGNRRENANASLDELTSLSRLNILQVDIAREECVPKEADFLPRLAKFCILVGRATEDALVIENLSRTPRDLILNDIVINNLPRWFQREILATTLGLKYTPRRAVNILIEFDKCGLLHSLQVLVIHACTIVQSLMNATGWNQSRSAFVNLVKLYLINLSHLKDICLGQLPTGCFTNLRILRVFNCPLLRKVMTAGQAKNLQQLEELEVSFNKAMEEIVGREGTEELHETIVFPRLRIVRLLEVINVTCFYGGDATFECPSLEEVIIDTCPNLKTFASGLLFTPKFRRIRALVMGRLLDIDVQKAHYGQLNAALRLHFSQWVEAISSRMQSTAKPLDPRSHLYTVFGLWEGHSFVDFVYKSIQLTSRIQYVVTYQNEELVSSSEGYGNRRSTVRVNVTPTIGTPAPEHQGSVGHQNNGITSTQSPGGSGVQHVKRLIISHESATLKLGEDTKTAQKTSTGNLLRTEKLATSANIASNSQSLPASQRILEDRPVEGSTLRDGDRLSNAKGNTTTVKAITMEKPGEVRKLRGNEGANGDTTMRKSGESGSRLENHERSLLSNVNTKSDLTDVKSAWEKGESSNAGGSQKGEVDKYSISRCIEVLTAIDSVSDKVYLQALKMFQDPNWRQTFISLPTERRVIWLRSLE